MRSIYFVCGLFVVGAGVAQLVWFGRLTMFASVLLVSSGAAAGAWCWATKRRVARELALLDEYGREL